MIRRLVLLNYPWEFTIKSNPQTMVYLAELVLLKTLQMREQG